MPSAFPMRPRQPQQPPSPTANRFAPVRLSQAESARELFSASTKTMAVDGVCSFSQASGGKYKCRASP